MKKPQAILLDFGNVLGFPTTGNWVATPAFNRLVPPQKLHAIRARTRWEALHAAQKFMRSQTLMRNEEEEYRLFQRFYEIWCGGLGLSLTKKQIDSLAYEKTYGMEQYTFPDGLSATLEKLHKTYRLAVVSDNWPSMERVLRTAGIRDFFEITVNSCEVGVCKPDRRMYRAALNALQLSPKDTIFLDDNPKNCRGAGLLSIRTLLVRPESDTVSQKLSYCDLLVIPSVDALSEYLDKHT